MSELARGGVMGIIMIRCPADGNDVSTGIEMADLEQLPNVPATMWCSECGHSHTWTQSEAWLANAGEQYRTAAKTFSAHAEPLARSPLRAQDERRH